jgi:3-hydroxy acid dehydrogenase / malonic semialdehyde reductase
MGIVNAHEDLGVAVVSGASSGIGSQTALTLAGQGYAVILLARRIDRLEGIVKAHPKLRLLAREADVREPDELESAFGRLPEGFKDISVLINNAGLSRGFGPIQSVDSKLWREMIHTNILGMLNLTELLLPRLIARGSGQVVNIGSIAANYPYLGANVYAATKSFVHQLTLNMRTDLQGTGVRVSCIAPGMTKTEFALVRFDGDARRADAMYQGVTPLMAEDVAEAVWWCLSRPPHVSVNMIELMPADQPFSLGFAPSAPSQEQMS